MPMTLRNRLLTTLRGGAPDRIPWNIYAWLLPPVPNAADLQQRGLSLMDARRIYRPVYDGVTPREERLSADRAPVTTTTIETPCGVLTQVATIEPNYGSVWIRKHFITGVDDYAAAEYFFRHTSFEPDFAPWRAADVVMGDAGIVIGEIMPVPLLYLMVSWMGAERMVEGIYDHPDRFAALITILNEHYQRQVEIAAASPAEVIWFPDNVTASIVSPSLFAQYCAPVYARAMPVMRRTHKIPIFHYDGSIRPLLHALAQTDLPVIEAFTPPPMGDVTVADAKAAWPDKVVWVNVPGNLFVGSSDVTEAYMLQLLQEGAAGGRLVIGCTEEFPIAESARTFAAVGRALARYEGREW